MKVGEGEGLYNHFTVKGRLEALGNTQGNSLGFRGGGVVVSRDDIWGHLGSQSIRRATTGPRPSNSASANSGPLRVPVLPTEIHPKTSLPCRW